MKSGLGYILVTITVVTAFVAVMWALLSAADYTINHQDVCEQHLVLAQC